MAFKAYRYAARKYNEAGEHRGPGPWLDLIRAANRIENGMFGAPTGQVAGEHGIAVEVYDHAIVDLTYQNHNDHVRPEDDGYVTVFATDARGDEILAWAAATIH